MFKEATETVSKLLVSSLDRKDTASTLATSLATIGRGNYQVKENQNALDRVLYKDC